MLMLAAGILKFTQILDNGASDFFEFHFKLVPLLDRDN